jgi:hypothetical protein
LMIAKIRVSEDDLIELLNSCCLEYSPLCEGLIYAHRVPNFTTGLIFAFSLAGYVPKGKLDRVASQPITAVPMASTESSKLGKLQAVTFRLFDLRSPGLRASQSGQ